MTPDPRDPTAAPDGAATPDQPARGHERRSRQPEQDVNDAQQTADQAQKDADAAKDSAAKANDKTEKAQAETDQAKAEAEAAESEATMAADCAKAYTSAIGTLFEGDDVRAQAAQVGEQLRGITDQCKAAFGGT